MPETNSHEGVSHPFGAKHGTPAKTKKNLAERMYPNFLDELAKGSTSFAGELGASRRAAAIEAVKSDMRDLSRTHDEKYHAGWAPYVPEPDAPVPYCSVGARPLGLGILTPPRINFGANLHTEHQQFICNDGENFGLTNDKANKDILIEDQKNLSKYIMSPVKYRKDIIMQARQDLDDVWQSRSGAKRYDPVTNNCQHTIQDVLNKAIDIADKRGVKLILN